LSRLVGRPLYNWIAANRGRLSALMNTKRWRQRLIYPAMSLFVAWHTFVMLVGPNGSATASSIRSALIQPYLSLFRLESTWAFFAPSVGKHSLFRYVIVDDAGHEHTFVPVDGLSRFLPSDYWFRNSYYDIIEVPELHAAFFAALFCREHAALHPASISLQAVQEQEFTPEDQLRGERPLDPEFVQVDTLLHTACDNQVDAGAREQR